MATTTKYDIIMIGSGQSGTPLAAAFAKAGRKTALIEREHLGGCCINEGCTPTKTLIASGRVAYLTRRAPDYGVHTTDQKEVMKNDVTIDMVRVRQRRRDMVDSFRASTERKTKEAGVDILTGEASFLDTKTLKVKTTKDGCGSERLVEGQTIFINTGNRPAPPKLNGIETIDKGRVLDSTSIQELDTVPGHLVVVGGGYVGIEFAHLFHRLGAKVTILHRGTQLLPQEDKDITDRLLEIFREDGLTVYLEANTTSISPSSPDTFDLAIRFKEGAKTVTGTHILFAAGRIPNTDALNLQAAGVKTDSKGYITTNEYLETSTPSIYALGDVKGGPAFTHISYDDFRIIRDNLLTPSGEGRKLSTRDRIVPYVVYTDPQVGHVGLHEQEARNKFPDRKILTATMPMSYVARALETGEPRGVMKAVVDGETGLILGFTCLATEGGEVMSMVETAMIGGMPYQKLRDAVWVHPTWAESLNNVWAYLK